MALGDCFRVAGVWNIQTPIQADGALHLRLLRNCTSRHLAGNPARVHRQPRRRMVLAVELLDW